MTARLPSTPYNEIQHEAFARTLRDMQTLLDTMEHMGISDMGNLPFRDAHKFHTATALIRAIVDDNSEASP